MSEQVKRLSTEQMMKGRTIVSVEEKLNNEGHVDQLATGLDDGGIVVIRELVLDKE